MHYLEKIFQIPLTLPPLDTVRYGRFVDDLLAAVGVEPVESPPAPVGDLLQEIFAASDGAVGTDATEAPGLTSARIRPFPADGAVLPAPPRTELANTLRLDPAEQSFLKLLGPPLISSPRSIKRLLNSYNLILAIEGPQGRPAVLGPVDAGGGRLVFPHRAALTILAVVIAFPEAAPGFAVHLHRAAAAKRWTDLLAEARFLGRGAEAIVDALDALTDAAATLDMALPELVGDWHPWIVKAGRLSFETGRVVVRLGDRG
jgi:hypothetical protein